MSGKEHTIFIKPDGSLHFLNINGADLGVLGPQRVRRISTVEFDAAAQMWFAQRVDGTPIGWYTTYDEAIEAEAAVLNVEIEAGKVDAILKGAKS